MNDNTYEAIKRAVHIAHLDRDPPHAMLTLVLTLAEWEAVLEAIDRSSGDKGSE